MAAWQRIDLASGRVVNVEEWDERPAETSGVLFRQQSGAGPGWIWDGATLRPPPPPAPDLAALTAEVDAERDRRITAGFTYQGKHFQSRPEDQDNIRDGYAKANRVIRDGGGAVGDVFWYGDGQPFGWIAADNDVMALDAPAMVEFAETLGQRKKDLIFAASEIKQRLRAGEVIPDVTIDNLWPA